MKPLTGVYDFLHYTNPPSSFTVEEVLIVSMHFTLLLLLWWDGGTATAKCFTANA